MTNPTLRKAAVLIASLDAKSADALLDEMAPEQAARVRNAVMELGDIDPQEQEAVIGEFVGRQPAAPNAAEDDGVELDLSETLSTADARAALSYEPTPRQLPNIPPRFFSCLEQADAQHVANMLAREHPQTAAIVVAHLSPDRAVDILRGMTADQQGEVLTRVARLGKLPPEIIRDIEEEMRDLLADRGQHAALGVEGVAAVQAILQAANSRQRQDLLAQLTLSDRILAGQLTTAGPPANPHLPADEGTGGRPPAAGRPGTCDPTLDAPRPAPAAPRLEFADLESLNDQQLARILHDASPNTTLLALAGAGRPFVQRILGQLPAGEARRLERKMEQLGPIRLNDVERAQQQLAQIARQLLAEEKPTSAARRFAVAA